MIRITNEIDGKKYELERYTDIPRVNHATCERVAAKGGFRMIKESR